MAVYLRNEAEMAKVREWARSLTRPALEEQKERYWLRWMQSGYRDARAHQRFLVIFEQLARKE